MRWMIFQALVLPCCIWLGFRLAGVSRTQALLRGWATHTTPGRTDDEETTMRIHDARRAQRLVKRTVGISGNCLVRSLTLWTLLRRRGVHTDLRVGFRKRSGRIEGHAWLEFHDAPINETVAEASSYVPYHQPVTFDLWRHIRGPVTPNR